MNWSGTYAITTPGTTLTSATSSTATNTGAVWPTTPSLAGLYIRLLSGTGSPATVPIVSNTATVITVSSWPNGTPDNTTTYELVLIVNSGDSVVGGFNLNTNVITEIANNALVTVTGAFLILFENSCTVRWGMSASTMPTFCSSTRTTSGKQGAWTGFSFASTLSIAPNFSYIKIQDAATAILVAESTGLGNGSGIHHLWIEDCGTEIANLSGAAATVKQVFSNIFARNSNGNLIFGATTSTFAQIFDTCWDESNAQGNVNFTSGGSNLQWLRNSVMKSLGTGLQTNANSGVEFRISECYFMCNPSNAIVLGCSSASDAGTRNGFMNSIRGSRFFFGTGTGGLGTLISFSNDIISTAQNNANMAINIASATSYTTATSNFDYMAGNNLAALENVDTSVSTTSTATPSQYSNLTASRTNANSSPNFPITINNISTGSPSSHNVSVTFDCQNGAQIGQRSTVNGTGSSGQTTLPVAATTPFCVGATVEIGYGTARAETGRIASISAGTSITLETNLTFSHTAVQADTVNLALRHYGLPFVRYGTASGNYNMQTQVPDISSWGPLWTGLQTSVNGESFTWKRTGHSVTINNLQSGTTYFYTPYAYNPLGELISGTEQSFTTPGITTSASFS